MKKNILDDLEKSSIRGGKAINLLKESGLNWQVNKVGLITPDGIDSGYFGNVREDTKTVLGVFKESYEVFQNTELAELAFELAKDFDLKVERGGALNGGRKIYIQLAHGEIKAPGENKGDIIKKYITALNSHDGSASVSFGMSNITVSCANTFFMAQKELKNRVRHSVSMRDRIDLAKREIEGIEKHEKSLYEIFFKLADKKVKPEHTVQLVEALTGVNIKKNYAKDEISTRKFNQAKDITRDIAREFKDKGETLYGLFNGITRYATHDISTPNREGAKIESVMFGGGATMNSLAFQTIKGWLN